MTKPIPFEVGQKVMDEATWTDGCLITPIPANSVNRYAYVGGYLAHRAAFTTANQRQIAPGMVIDHTCFNRLCMNPMHLRELTRRENSMRKTGDAWPLGQCKWGHPDSERRSVNWASRKVRTECGTCRDEINRAQVQRDKYLRRLELTYGLRLSRRQREMVEEFMPELLEERAA
jgi:hypothetical protein